MHGLIVTAFALCLGHLAGSQSAPASDPKSYLPGYESCARIVPAYRMLIQAQYAEFTKEQEAKDRQTVADAAKQLEDVP